MSFLNALSAEEKEQIVSLPYLIGLSVSNADDVEGERDDKLEMRALNGCLKAVAQRYDGVSVVAEILSETIRRRADWPAWEETGNIYNLAPAARQAAASVLRHTDKKTARDFRAAMMEIAGAVARASGEFAAFDGMDDTDQQGFLGRLLSGFGAVSADEAHHPMNVSAAEDEVLSLLSEALKG